jgi:hypothetical protein
MWTGYTRFKVLPAWRKQAKELFNKNLEECYAQESSNQPLNERYMSLEDRMTFREAKMKELQSFFDNSVWQFDNGKNVPADRVLKGKFILGWKKNPDGSPRAKARLVVQGFKDPDALSGSLSTTSPTLTRLARGVIMTVATMLGMEPFTSDVSTAFLQGKDFKTDGSREIWVRLPRDAEQILGIERKRPTDEVDQAHLWFV